MGVLCEGCGWPYGGIGWCDVLVPDQVWDAIIGRLGGGGTLCFNCIAERCERLGLMDVPFAVKSGPLRVSEEDPLGYYWCNRSKMWRTGRRDQELFAAEPGAGEGEGK